MEENKSHPVEGVMQTAMESIRDMVDASTIIGEMIHTSAGTDIIPISKVSFGFASGGSDFTTKTQKDIRPNFGGGGGAGVTISPIAFLVIEPDGRVSMLNVNQTPLGAVDRALGLIPEVVEKIKNKSADKQKN